MPKTAKPILVKILLLLLRPVVAFCLRHSLRLQDIIECSKAVFVELGRRELERGSSKANVSRLSAMSGVHRRDVTRMLKDGPAKNYEKDLITKVVGQWQTDSRFTTSKHLPRVLSISTERSEFNDLVYSVSKDLNPGTVFFELERVGAIESTPRGIKLVIESYVPKGDPVAGFNIWANDAEDLTETVEENVLSEGDIRQFHARTSYDNVRPDAVPEMKRWFGREGHEFHARVREYVSQFDQDINPDPKFKGRGVKVTFSSFSNVKDGEE
jgi:hypothetical protein